MSKNRSHIISEDEIIGTPDLVMEIISQGIEERDRGYLVTERKVRSVTILDFGLRILDSKKNNFSSLNIFSENREKHI